jgi:hypothetical protein
VGTLSDLLTQFGVGQGQGSGLTPSGNLSGLLGQYGINPSVQTQASPVSYTLPTSYGSSAPASSGGGGLSGLFKDAGGALGALGNVASYGLHGVLGTINEGGRLIGHQVLGTNYGTPITYKTDAAGNNYAVDPNKADHNTYATSAQDPAALSPEAARAQQGNLNPTSPARILKGIFDPSQQPTDFSNFLTGNPQRGIEGLFHPNGQPGQASITGAGLNPIAAAGLGLVGDIALDPLTYIAPEATVREATNTILDQTASKIAQVTGREMTPELLQSIANGSADFSALAPEQQAAVEAFKQQATDALGALHSGGLSAVPKDLADEFGLKAGLNLKLGKLANIPLTHGEGPLSNISTAFHGGLSKLGDVLAPVSDKLGRQAVNAAGENVTSPLRALARSGDFEASFTQRIAKTAGSTEANLGRAFAGDTNKIFAGHSPDEIAAAHEAIDNHIPLDTLDPKVADLATKMSDHAQTILARMKAAGIDIRGLELGTYVPHPIQSDMRSAMEQAELWPTGQGYGTQGRSFAEQGRTLWDPETKIASIGVDGPNSVRLTTTAESRQAAEKWANEQIAKRLEAKADPAWLNAHPDIAAGVKSGELNLWQHPADAWKTMDRMAARRIAQAEAGQKLFSAGIGTLDPRFARPSPDTTGLDTGGPVTPPESGTTGSPLSQAAPAAQPTGPVNLYRGQAPPLDGNLGTNSWTNDISEAQTHAAAEPGGTVFHTQISAAEAATANAEAKAAGDFGARGGGSVHHITPEAANRGVELSPEAQAAHVKAAVVNEGHVVEQAAHAAVTRPPNVDPAQSIDDAKAAFKQNFDAALGIPPTPQSEAILSTLTQADDAAIAQAVSPEAQKFQEILDQATQSGDHRLAEWARLQIHAANLGAAHDAATRAASDALDQWDRALADPALVDRMAGLAKDEPINYMQYRSLQPGILTPSDVADHILSNSRYTPSDLAQHWQAGVKFLRRWQLATPGLSVRIMLGQAMANAGSEWDVGLRNYSEASRLLHAWSTGAELGTEDAAKLARLQKLVGMGQVGEAGALDALKTEPSLAQRLSRYNPLSGKGPIVRNVSKLTSYSEQWGRAAMALNGIDRGATDDTIANMIAHYHFDFNDLSKGEQAIRANIMPGYTFMRNNVPLQMQMLVDNPKMFARVWEAKQAVETQTQKDPVTPGYFMSLLNTAIPGMSNGGGNNYVSLSNMLPTISGLQTIANPINERVIGGGTGGGMGGFGGLIGSLSPTISTPIEYLFSKQTNGLPLADNKAVPVSMLHLPTWIDAPLKAAGIVGSVNGTDYITNKNLFLVTKWLPFFARYQQATGGSKELPKIISFFTGQYFSTNTTQQQSTTQYFSGPAQHKTLASIIKSLNKAKVSP